MLFRQDLHIQIVVDIELEGANPLQLILPVIVTLDDLVLELLLLIDALAIRIIAFFALHSGFNLSFLIALGNSGLVLKEPLALLDKGPRALVARWHS